MIPVMDGVKNQTQVFVAYAVEKRKKMTKEMKPTLEVKSEGLEPRTEATVVAEEPRCQGETGDQTLCDRPP